MQWIRIDLELINSVLFSFSSCDVGDLEITKGDYVFISSGTQQEAYIAQIMEMYDTGEFRALCSYNPC